MSLYEIAFLLVASGILMLSAFARNVRGVIWVTAIMADVVLSDVYVQYGYPISDGFMACADLLVCGALYYVAAHRWELWLWMTMLASAAISIFHLGVSIDSPGLFGMEDYLTALEACNYVAILIIGGVSGFVFADRQGGVAFRPWRRIAAFVHPLYRESSGARG